jgi:hypothetical protein
MARYPHGITVTRAAAGTSAGDMVGGAWIANPLVTPATVYSGPADCQDTPKALARDTDGIATITADAIVFLPRGVSAALFLPEDHCVVTWEDGTTDDARVMESRRLDDRIALEWL